MSDESAPETTTSRGDKGRLKGVARALINYADSNNDGFLARSEALGIGQVATKAQEDLSMVRSAIETQNTLNLEILKTPTDKTPHMMTAPLMRPIVYTGAYMMDYTIFDRMTFMQQFSKDLNLDKSSIDRLVKEVLPKGVENIRLSDMCTEIRELNCAPLPNGTIAVYVAKGRTD